MQLEPGDPAPQFKAIDEESNQVSLGDFAGGKLVMYFYPAAFTPGCTTESCDFRDWHEALSDAGYSILGVSPDEPDKLKKFRAEYNLPFPLLSDPDHVIAEAYGAWGTKKNYGKEYQGIIRSTITIDDGTVEHAWYNVRAKGHANRVAESVLEAG
jgi:thioredoxin-dependent peroxiredoxin